MNVLHADAIAGMVVPYGKHTTKNSRVVLVKLLVAYLCRCPFVVEIFAVEIVVIVTSSRNYVCKSVGDADELIALSLHLLRVGITVVPAAHYHIVRLHLSVAIGMSKRSPKSSLLAERLYIFNIAVGEVAELLYHFLLRIRVFVGTDVHHLATAYGVLALKILLEESVDKLICLGIEQIEMVHAILLRANLRLVVSESQCMCRHVNLRNDVDAILLGKFLKVDEFFLSVRSVACCQSGISVTLQSKCSLSLVPIIVEELTETVVVEMNLQGVHLIVSHGLDKRTQIVHRDELTTAVHHKSTQTILRRVYNIALWQ